MTEHDTQLLNELRAKRLCARKCREVNAPTLAQSFEQQALDRWRAMSHTAREEVIAREARGEVVR